MSKRSTLNVSLPERQRRLVDEVVCEGEYGSASEVVRESLRLWETVRRRETAAAEWVRDEIASALEESRRGEGEPADVVFDRILGEKPATLRRKASRR